VGFTDAEKAACDRQIIRKSRSEALMLLARVPPREACKPPAPRVNTIRALEKKEARAKFVPAAMKFPIPICGELVVGVFTRTADDERTGMRPTAQVSGFTVTPGVPAIDGIK